MEDKSSKFYKITGKLIDVFKLFFVVIFSIIVFKTFFNNNRVKMYDYNPLLLILLVIGYLIIVLFLYKVITRISFKHKKSIVAIIFGITVLLQLVFSYFFMVIPSWDVGFVYDIVTNFDMSISSKITTSYLYQYPNNIGITILLSVVFNFFKLINIDSYTVIGIGLNILFIDLAILFLYKVAKELFGYNRAIFVLILMCTMTPIYTYAPIFYTDTLSMLYPILLLYLYILLSKKSNENSGKKINKEIILLSIAMGLTVAIGIQIKVTIVILFVALIIIELLFLKSKYIFKVAGIVVSTILLLLFAKNTYLKNIKDPIVQYLNEFPYTHWVMMGLNDNPDNSTIGGFYGNDNIYTDLLPDGKNGRKEGNIKVIKERLSNFIAKHDLLRFELSKMVYTWGDGTYYAPEKLRRSPVREEIQHQFVLQNGKYSYVYMYYSQIQHISLLIFMIISMIINYRNRKEFNDILKDKVNLIITLSIFGLLIFLIIWETRSRYIVNFIPIMVLAEFYGIDKLYDYILISRKKLLPKSDNIQ